MCVQATLSGMLTAGMFYFISNAKPLPQLSPVRPHPSIFCVYFFASLLGQFALQLGFLIVMYRWDSMKLLRTLPEAIALPGCC
jgi:cation-transporting ATPase 13A1